MIRDIPGKKPRVHADAFVDVQAAVIGDNVTIGHRAVVHGCTVGANRRIGLSAAVMRRGLVQAGAHSGGAGGRVRAWPARPVRRMSPEELEDILRNAREYEALWRAYYGPRRA